MSAGFQLKMVIDCDVNQENDAHSLGRELEDRIRNYLTQQIPNLRNIQALKSGTITFSLTIRGRRIRIVTGDNGAQIEGQKGSR